MQPREQAEGGRTHEQLHHGMRSLHCLQLWLHQVGTGTGAIPNRNGRTLEVTLSKPVIPMMQTNVGVASQG